MAEIESAIDRFRMPGSLCYAHVWTQNQGLSCELSFNSCAAQSASGVLEITLREATIEVTSPASGPDWSWNDGLLEAADDNSYEVEQIVGDTEAASRATSADLRGRVSGKGKAGLAGVGAELGAEVRQGSRTDERSDRSRSRQVKLKTATRHIKIERRQDSFRVNFAAHNLDDLSDLNTKLTRLPLLDLPAPAALDVGQVNVDLYLSLDPDGEDVRHAFHVRKATGTWRALTDNPKRAVLAELLLSKFLPEIHRPQRLHPKAST